MIPGVCPDCGLRADLLVFAEQAGANAGLAAALALPPLLGGRILRYLRLFNPPRKVLASAKATRLLTELAAAVDSAQVERRGVAHAAPVGLWAAALDAVLAQPPERLPLDGHGYLLAVAWNLAERAAGRQERQAEERLRHGERPASTGDRPAMGTGDRPAMGTGDRPVAPTFVPSPTARREAGLQHARNLMGLLKPWMNPADPSTGDRPAMGTGDRPVAPASPPIPTPTREDSPCSD